MKEHNYNADVFRQRFFAGASETDWQDWRWQMRHRLRTLKQLEAIFNLSDDERAAIKKLGDGLPLAITPYYASLMDLDNPLDPLRRTHIPSLAEFAASPHEKNDPLGEDKDMVVSGLVHRYPDRALFLVSNTCATYCRYCNRARMVGNIEDYSFPVAQWEKCLDYIRKQPAIRDVLVSGGDPLLIQDEKLSWLLEQLRAIPHVDFIRISTKIPMVLPQRITEEFASVLKRAKPWLTLHITHPEEFTPDVAIALNRLADHGIVISSQTVLLKGVNDDGAVMKELMRQCLIHRVRPYYLYQCDPIIGSEQFRVPVEEGLNIIEQLRGHTTGYAVPHYAIDIDGGGKMPLLPDYVVGRDGDHLVLRNYKNETYRYYDPIKK